MRISRTTLIALLAVAGAGRRGGNAVTLVCTVEGGLACRLARGDWDEPALTPLTARLIGEIGWKTIEHAAGCQAVIRCAIEGDAAHAECRIELGDGFEDLPVREQDDG
jgi:hypothetical protein